MSEFLTWLDYSDRERREALDVVDLFREQDTVDELGIGSIRDGLANHFFPGTSTIQTRVRYFLFIPWLFQEMERKRVPSAQMARRGRLAQDQLCRALVAAGESLGVIGQRAGVAVRRLPSSVYWFGLREWGIRLCPASEDQYCRSLDAYYCARERVAVSDDDEPIGDVVEPNWHPCLPPLPQGFPEGVRFALTAVEAEYLTDRILSRAPGTLLAEFLTHRALATGVDFPWQHPLVSELRPELVEALHHARRFSVTMHGAILLYNLILAELVEREELVEDYRERLTSWWEEQVVSDSRASWRLPEFWKLLIQTGARVPVPTRQFVESWIQQATLASSAATLMGSDTTRRLIQNRERMLKRGRARVDNEHAREMWNGESGTARIDYRWSRPVRTMIDEIVTPLREVRADA